MGRAVGRPETSPTAPRRPLTSAVVRVSAPVPAAIQEQGHTCSGQAGARCWLQSPSRVSTASQSSLPKMLLPWERLMWSEAPCLCEPSDAILRVGWHRAGRRGLVPQLCVSAPLGRT